MEDNKELKRSNNKKKAIIVILIFTLILVGLLVFVLLLPKKEKKEEEPKKIEQKLIMELDNYKDLSLDNVIEIEKIRFTEAGDARETITEKSEITSIYNMLKSTKIADETNRACEDNTTVYNLITEDEKYTFEFECSWFVYNGKRYNVAK